MQPTPHLVKLAITTGDPAGIGPEVSLAAAREFLIEQPNAQITLLGDAVLFKNPIDTNLDLPHQIKIDSIPLASTAIPGVLNSANAQYVLNLLDQASDACLRGDFDAMVTAPVQKSLMNIANSF